MFTDNIFVAVGLAYILGVTTGPWWLAAWRLLTRSRRRGFEDYYPDDRPRKRRKRGAED